MAFDENASAAFLDVVRKSMRAIRTAIGAATINPALLTCAERLQYDSYLRREDVNSTITKLLRWRSIKEIVRQTGYSSGTVRQIVRGHRTDVFRVRQSSLEAYLPLLDQLWGSGQHNGAELWRQLKCKGFRGCSRVVGEWAARRRRSERVCDQQLQKVPSARTIARLMTTARDKLSKADTITIAAIEAGVPALIQARNLIDRFQTMIRRKGRTELDPWIADARDSLFAPQEKAAVSAAITEPWSNGQVEGQINKLKLVKRQMYGRAKLDHSWSWRCVSVFWSCHSGAALQGALRRATIIVVSGLGSEAPASETDQAAPNVDVALGLVVDVSTSTCRRLEVA